MHISSKPYPVIGTGRQEKTVEAKPVDRKTVTASSEALAHAEPHDVDHVSFKAATYDPTILKSGVLGKIYRLALTIRFGKKEVERRYTDTVKIEREHTLAKVKDVKEYYFKLKADPNMSQPDGVSDEVWKAAQTAVIINKNVNDGSTLSGDPLMAKLPSNGSDYKNKVDEIKKYGKTPLALAHMALGKYNNDDLEPLKSGDGKEWQPLSFKFNNGVYEARPGSVNPTSERNLNVANNLNNVYVHIDYQGHISISCGVIDTKDKADQFMAAVQWAMQKQKEQFVNPPPLRISMHQLNAMGNESKLITAQKKMADYIDMNLGQRLVKAGFQVPDGPLVSHGNRCMNGFTRIPGEENKSHEINLSSSLAVQAEWLSQDLEGKLQGGSYETYRDAQALVSKTLLDIKVAKQNLEDLREALEIKYPELKKISEEIEQLNSDIHEIKQQISDCGEHETDKIEDLNKKNAELLSLKEQLLNLEKKENAILGVLKTNLEQQEKIIKEGEKALKGQLKNLVIAMAQIANAPEDIQVKLSVAVQLMGTQLEMEKELKQFGIRKLTPAQEIGVQLLWDNMLGCVTEINCKSGLDRTAFVRAMNVVIKNMLQAGKSPLDVFNFIVNFDDNVKKLDQSIKLGEKQAKAAGKDFNYQKWLEGRSPAEKEVSDFQMMIFNELINVGLPVTERSCGAPGLKWNHSKHVKLWNPTTWNPLEKNPHPMPFLPKYVIDGSGQQQELIRVGVNGNRSMSTLAKFLLEGSSKQRGA